MKKYHTVPETKKQLFANVEEKEIIEEKPKKVVEKKIEEPIVKKTTTRKRVKK